MKRLGLLFFFLLFTAPALAAQEEAWPEGLAEAAAATRAEMRAEALEVQESTADAPRGMMPVMAFERESHLCHEVEGQVYRDFGEPRLQSVGEDGAVRVRYPFRLFYRRHEEAKKVFNLPWSEGSDGLWEVRFEKTDAGWIVLGSREVLDLGSRPGHPGEP